MRLPQLQRPLQFAVMAGGHRSVLASFALPTRPMIPTAQTLRVGDAAARGVEGRRYASVKSQGAYRIPNKKTIGKKLGAKRSGDQFVIPGNIIFKQRGTMWHAGFNAIRGRDHTIHAAATGYVKYYRDPSLHPDKQYIGVAFNKEDKLPYPNLEPRRRKLGMVAHTRKKNAGPRPKNSDTGIPNSVLRKAGLFNIEALERRLWNADKRLELKLAAEQDAKAAKAGLRGIAPEAVSPLFSKGKAVPKTSASAPKTATVSQPVVRQPVVRQTVVRQTVVSQTVVSEPVVSEPVVSQTVVSETVVSEPVVSEPVVSEPVVSEPVVSEPVVSQPVESQLVVEHSPGATSADDFAKAAVASAPGPSSKSRASTGSKSAVTKGSGATTAKKSRPAGNRPRTTTILTKYGRRITINLPPPAKPPRDTNTGRPESVKVVTASEYLQKTWQERRRTKVLILNPRTYAYAESNAAIGRLPAKTMYTPLWKLGGRKSRFRSRRKHWVIKIEKKKADRILVRTEREKMRVAAEKKRAKELAKQRARGRKTDEQTATLQGAAVTQAAEAVEAAAAIEEAAPAEAAILIDSATSLVEAAGLSAEKTGAVDGADVAETASPIGTAANTEAPAPVETPVNEPLAESKGATKAAEAQKASPPVEAEASPRPAEARIIEKPVGIQESAQAIETRDAEKSVQTQSTAQPVEAEKSSQPAGAKKEAEATAETQEGDAPSKP